MKKFRWFRSMVGGCWVKGINTKSATWRQVNLIDYKDLMRVNDQSILKFESYNTD